MSTHYLRFNWRNAVSRQRCPRLEQLLARSEECGAVGDWRAAAFEAVCAPGAAMPGVGAAALFADQGAVAGAAVLMATPVRYVADMSNVRLPADGILALRQAEAQALADDFNRVWHDAGVRLLAGRGAALYCVTEQPMPLRTCDPADALERHIDTFLPAGDAAPRLRQLMSEIEMWLFDHAVNRSRIAQAAPALTGLWLWGCGPALASLPQVVGWTQGHDPLFDALAMQSDASRVSSSGVAVMAAPPGTDTWRDVESHWLERSAAALRSGRIARLLLSAGQRTFSVRAGRAWRFWRRRPWWEFFA